jgi:hypothetical protein
MNAPTSALPSDVESVARNGNTRTQRRVQPPAWNNCDEADEIRG